MSTEELLQSWRDATKAAELAERLAASALRAAERADADSTTAEEIATLAEETAATAQRAAEAARAAARQAKLTAERLRGTDVVSADDEVTSSRAAETDARDRYHDWERQAREKWGGTENRGS